MKVIIFTTKLPYPIDSGGTKRIISIANYLKKNDHYSTLISFSNNNEGIIELKEIFNEVHVIKLSTYKKIINIIKNIFSKTPFQVAIYNSTKMKELCRALSSQNSYDLSIFHLVRGTQYRKYLKSREYFLEMTDSIALNIHRALSKTLSLKLFDTILKFIYFLELPKMKKFEINAIRSFDKTILVSDADKSFIEKNANKDFSEELKVIPLAVDDEIFKYCSDRPDKNLIIFIGKMSYLPNEEAAIFFSKKIFPLILKKNPKAIFRIIGANPSSKVKNLRNLNKSIEITGRVENIFDEICKAQISVAPMQSGAGMQTKIIESMALGVPVVTNDLGYEGLLFENDEIIVSNDVNEFAEHVLFLMNEEECRNQISKKAIKAIQQKHSHTSVMRKYFNF